VILENALSGLEEMTEAQRIKYDPKPSSRPSQKKTLPEPNETRWYGYRQTKRRKGYKSSGFLGSRENQDEDLFLEEGDFMSLRSIKKFVYKVQSKKWYVGSLLCMLQKLCLDVQEPLQLWKRHVDDILGLERDCDESDSSYSVDEEEKQCYGNPEKKEESEEMSSNSKDDRFITFEEI
jgi:hypothetical protein